MILLLFLSLSKKDETTHLLSASGQRDTFSTAANVRFALKKQAVAHS